MDLEDLLGSGSSDNLTDLYNNSNGARLCYTKGRVEVCVRCVHFDLRSLYINKRVVKMLYTDLVSVAF